MWWWRFGYKIQEQGDMVTINENLNQNVKEGVEENYNDIKIICLLLAVAFIFYKIFIHLKKYINKKINNGLTCRNFIQFKEST